MTQLFNIYLKIVFRLLLTLSLLYFCVIHVSVCSTLWTSETVCYPLKVWVLQ